MDVSVIIPVYNGEKNIKRLFKCLQRQRKREVEFIFVNDGSTDKTDSILNELLNSYNDRRFIYKKLSENKGVSNARNIGIDIAQGRYLIFVDSDDIFTEDFVSVYYKRIYENKTDIEFFSFNAKKNQQKYVDYSKFDNGNVFNSEELLKMFFSQKLRTFLFSFISKASLWTPTSFETGITYQEDTLALINIILCNDIKARFNTNCYYLYNSENNSNVSNNLSIEQYWQAVKVDKKIAEIIKNRNKLSSIIPNLYSKELSELMGVIVCSLRKNNMFNYYKARQQYIETYKMSSNITFKQKIKRRIQYLLLINNNIKVLRLIYSKIM
ncbi:glycosyltransferase family 2 protein [Limosilactobacillus walteri]|uniref:Glycosyltransferase family 2 protein n=1 Tax=Limosilactobacillus walteri TaxID=2268022 RepID=A0ABR8P8T5_9LACO|nr:glycosyltransferase family 2 protein [Limosilactobacillus walteri]MBD5807107.1 glycosyltransferase family 2 protein [Limosilactobacillus walteri]